MRYQALAAAFCTLVAVPAMADDPFPNEWFYDGDQRPAQLRELEGKPAKDFTAAEWRGESTSLADLKGKVVVLDFWATWCGPCMASIPHNVELVDKYKSEGLAFVGIHDSKNGWDSVDKVINEKDINYPVALDDSGKSTKAYNLRFWPTYVLIDRSGVVRAAGMSPNHVEEAVKILLAEPYEGATAEAEPTSGGFPDAYFFGGEKRPSWLRAAEGKPLTAFGGEEWIGDPIQKNDWARKVLVVQFVHPRFAKSFDHLEAEQAVRERFMRQGVVFAAVCDARGDFEAASAELQARDIATPMVLDTTAEGADAGVIAKNFGVRFSQPLAVVDRAGVIRANGLNPEHLEDVLNALLAEPMPPVAPEGEHDAAP